jgi:2-succinyl-5-enolpyruvyl-6-hydroxy-3-cyclohexene-1-carboxylate synthase
VSRDLNTSFARTLVDEWAAAGVAVAAVSPGSRSTPLALALAADGRVAVHVLLDERSAGFFALGAGKASGRPAVVLCTSGTAAAELHPAVLEAFHSRAPLLVCTADRPPELRDTGAGQAVDQLKLYGAAVRWFAEVGAPEEHPGADAYWRSVAARAATAAQGPPAGPVHLNLAFREPLVPTGGPVEVGPGRGPRTVAARPAPSAPDVRRVADLVAAHPRGALVAGWGADLDPAVAQRFSRRAAWPVLADPLSGLRCGARAVSAYDALLRAPDVASTLRPDLAVRVGAALTSKPATAWLDAEVRQVVVDPDGAWLDPQRSAGERLVVDAGALLDGVCDLLEERAATGWLDRWLAADAAARAALDCLLDSWEAPFEGRVARDLVGCLPAGATLVVGSSMPVRDVESFAGPRSGLRLLSNRGVNGIDGFVSTVLGVAACSSPVAALCGDLTFLHDAGGLLAAAGRGIDATFVVVDNDGGGIFSFLPHARGPAAEHFELLFGTPHGVDLAALAAVHGIPAEPVLRAADLVPAVLGAVDAGGVRLVLVRTERADNVDRHRAAWAAAAAAAAGP